MKKDNYIRKMQQEDLPQVAELFQKVFNANGENWSAETAFSHVEENFIGDAHWTVSLDGSIVGFLMGNVITWENGDQLFIDAVVVNEEHQRKGLGTVLWQEAEAYVREHGLKGVKLLANPSFDSFKWYKKMGYMPSNWMEIYKDF